MRRALVNVCIIFVFIAYSTSVNALDATECNEGESLGTFTVDAIKNCNITGSMDLSVSGKVQVELTANGINCNNTVPYYCRRNLCIPVSGSVSSACFEIGYAAPPGEKHVIDLGESKKLAWIFPDYPCTDNSGSAQFEIVKCISDSCPDDPNKTEPGECGCGAADISGIDPEQSPVTEGTKINAVTENPSDASVKWSIKPATKDDEGKVHASITGEGATATISKVSGEGDMIITVTSGTCTKEFPIKIGCKACEGGSGQKCNDEAGSASEVGL